MRSGRWKRRREAWEVAQLRDKNDALRRSHASYDLYSIDDPKSTIFIPALVGDACYCQCLRGRQGQWAAPNFHCEQSRAVFLSTQRETMSKSRHSSEQCQITNTSIQNHWHRSPRVPMLKKIEPPRMVHGICMYVFAMPVAPRQVELPALLSHARPSHGRPPQLSKDFCVSPCVRV